MRQVCRKIRKRISPTCDHIKAAVRTCAYIIKGYKALFRKARKQLLTIKFITIMEQKTNFQQLNQLQQSKVDGLFTLVKNKKGKVQICIGAYLVSSKEFKNFKDADAYLERRPYEILINTSVLIMEQQRKQNENKETKENT